MAQPQTPPTAPSASLTAEQAVEKGLQVFQGGKAGEDATKEALALFERAMELSPSRPEARAALYNAGCCHAKLKQWQSAVDAVQSAINEWGLKLSVAMEDKDLAPLRERREWLDVAGQLRGGVSDNSLVQLRSEAKAPFRLTRLIFGSGLLFGAGLGLLIIGARLVQAIQGGEGAPDTTETLKNLAINGAAVAVLGWIVRRDLTTSDRDKRVVLREESLARLQVAVGKDRVLPIASFRGRTRPVLLAGSQAWLKKAVDAAEPYREELQLRGVSIVKLPLAAADDPADRLKALKREFKRQPGKSSQGFGTDKEVATAALKAAAQPAAKKTDAKWILEPVEVPEWLTWIAAQQSAANVEDGENVFVQVSLDGTVRSSGLGVPPWQKFVGDLAPLDDVRTKLTRQ